MVCDICNAEGTGTLVGAPQLRDAVFKRGFNPFTLGLIPEAVRRRFPGGDESRAYSYWKEHVVAPDTSDWNLCDRCSAAFLPYGAGRAPAQEGIGEPHAGPDSGQPASNLKYFELKTPFGDGHCMDGGCPCSGASIPQGQGFLWVTPECAEFRSRTPDIRAAAKEKIKGLLAEGRMTGTEDLQRKMDEIMANLLCPGVGVPLLVCERAARRWGLNLEVAAEDARRWWNNERVPARATPDAAGPEERSGGNRRGDGTVLGNVIAEGLYAPDAGSEAVGYFDPAAAPFRTFSDGRTGLLGDVPRRLAARLGLFSPGEALAGFQDVLLKTEGISAFLMVTTVEPFVLRYCTGEKKVAVAEVMIELELNALANLLLTHPDFSAVNSLAAFKVKASAFAEQYRDGAGRRERRDDVEEETFVRPKPQPVPPKRKTTWYRIRMVFACIFIFMVVARIIYVAVSTPPPPSNRNTNKVGYVNTANLTLRAGPGRGSANLAILPEGTQVIYLDDNQNVNGSTWVKVRAGSQEGWVNEKLLR